MTNLPTFTKIMRLLTITFINVVFACVTPVFSEVLTEPDMLSMFEKIIDPVEMSTSEIYEALAEIEKNIGQYSTPIQQTFNRLWCWYQYLDEYEDYIVFATEQLKIAEQNNDLIAMADLHTCRAYFNYLLDEYESPLTELAQALDLAERSGNPQIIGDVYATRGEIYSYFGEIANALADYQRAAKNYELADNEYFGGFVVTEIARALRRMEDFDGALSYLDKQTVYYQSINDPISEASIAADYGDLYLDKDEPEIANQWFDRAIEIIDQVMETETLLLDDRVDAIAYYSKAEALARMGLADEAEQALNKSLEIEPEDTIPMPPYTSLIRAYIANARQDYTQAIEFALNSVNQYIELENDRMLNYALSELIKAYANSQDYQKAYEGTLQLNAVHKRLKDNISEQYSQRLKTEYQLAQTETENQALTFENKNNLLKIEHNQRIQRLQTMVIIMACLLFVLMARRIYVHIHQARKLTSLAMSDPLTGLSNRRAIESFAESTYLNILNEYQPVSVIAFDIDHFKKINDTYGHDVGDLVIKHVADLAKKCLREHDMLSRYGGEEYLAVLPGTALDQATVIAERVCQNIANASLNHLKDGLSVTISIGVAEKLPAELNPASTIRRADTALYDAKNAGRNQVKTASPAN